MIMVLRYVDCPIICLIMSTVKSGSVFLSGLWSSRTSEAWSVASASAAKVSIIRLIHKGCTVLSADCSDVVVRFVVVVVVRWSLWLTFE